MSPFHVARSIASALHVAGPHCNNDAACSSGYLAIHHAMQSLLGNECCAAVVAGVGLLLKPDTVIRLYSMGVLSPSGIMRPFDIAADWLK